jgi:hypothetical protein
MLCGVEPQIPAKIFSKCVVKADHKAPTDIEFSPNYLDLVVELAGLRLIAGSN